MTIKESLVDDIERHPVYYNEMKMIEDQPEAKIKIPHDWEKNPMTDRNYYMKSPQMRFSLAHGDFSERRY